MTLRCIAKYLVSWNLKKCKTFLADDRFNKLPTWEFVITSQSRAESGKRIGKCEENWTKIETKSEPKLIVIPNREDEKNWMSNLWNE